MRIECDYFDYIDSLKNRRIVVQGLLIKLGKLGILTHPVQTIKLRLEERKINRIDNDIKNMTDDLNSLKPGYSNSILEDAMEFYIKSHPITKKGISLVKKPRVMGKTRD